MNSNSHLVRSRYYCGAPSITLQIRIAEPQNKEGQSGESDGARGSANKLPFEGNSPRKQDCLINERDHRELAHFDAACKSKDGTPDDSSSHERLEHGNVRLRSEERRVGQE